MDELCEQIKSKIDPHFTSDVVVSVERTTRGSFPEIEPGFEIVVQSVVGYQLITHRRYISAQDLHRWYESDDEGWGYAMFALNASHEIGESMFLKKGVISNA